MTTNTKLNQAIVDDINNYVQTHPCSYTLLESYLEYKKDLINEEKEKFQRSINEEREYWDSLNGKYFKSIQRNFPRARYFRLVIDKFRADGSPSLIKSVDQYEVYLNPMRESAGVVLDDITEDISLFKAFLNNEDWRYGSMKYIEVNRSEYIAVRNACEMCHNIIDELSKTVDIVGKNF